MAKRIKGITIEIGGETKGLDKALGEVNKKSRDLQKELKDVDRLLKFNPGNAELIAQKQKLLAEQVENTSEKLKRLKDAQKEVQEQFERGEISEEQYRAFQRELVETESKLESLDKQLQESQSKLIQFGEKAGEAGEKLKAIGGKMTDVGKSLTTKVTAPILGVGVASAKMAMDFEAQMSRVGAIAGATADEMTALKDAALKLGAETSKSASEVAVAMEDMAAMGFTATEIIGAMPGVISASEASGGSLALAAQTVAAALNIWSLEATEASRVADVLAMAANASAAGIGDMQMAFKYAGAPAAALGIGMEEVAAAIGIMTDAGLEGSNAGTSLRASLLSLNNPAKAQQKIMEELGFSIRDGEGNAKSMSDMIGDLVESTKDMTEADKVATVAKLVGTEAVSGFLSLMKAGPTEIDKMTDALKNSKGASKETADIMKDNLKGSLEELGGSLETAAIQIGTALIPTIQSIAEFIRGLVEKFTELSPAAQQMIIVIAGIVAAIGPLLLILGMFASSIGSILALMPVIMPVFASAGAAIAAISAPVMLAIAAVVALIAIGVALWKNWDTVKANALKLWESFKTNFSGIYQAVSAYMTMAKNILLAVWSYIKGTFQNALAFIKALVTGDFKGMSNAIKAQMENVKKLITTVWEGIKTFLKNIDLKQIGKDIIQGLINGVTAMAGKVLESVTGVVDGAINKAKKLLGIKSPSRVFMQIGEYTGEGLAKGMDSTSGLIQKASDKMAGLTIPRVPKLDSPGLNGNSGSNGSVSNSFNFERMLEGAQFIVREEADIEKIAKKLNDYIRMSARGKGVVM